MSTQTVTETNETTIETTQKPTKKVRGFAAMDRRRVSEIASKGGKAAHAAGTAHKFTTEEAKAAGKKGGLAPRRKRSTVSTPVDNHSDA